MTTTPIQFLRAAGITDEQIDDLYWVSDKRQAYRRQRLPFSDNAVVLAAKRGYKKDPKYNHYKGILNVQAMQNASSFGE